MIWKKIANTLLTTAVVSVLSFILSKLTEHSMTAKKIKAVIARINAFPMNTIKRLYRFVFKRK